MKNRPNNMDTRHLKILICTIIIAITIAIYSPIAHYPFINFDDNLYVSDNPVVQHGITSENILWAILPGYGDISHKNYWHPVTWLSHMLDCQLFGLDPGMHHLVSLGLHTATSIILFLTLSAMTGALWKSAFVAFLFAIHPININSVAWIAERKNVLSALFWMLTMAAYFYYVSRPTFKRYLLIFVPFLLGLMSKPTLVTLPFTLILLDFWPLKRILTKTSDPDSIARHDNLVSGTVAGAGIKRIIFEKVPMLPFALAAMLIPAMTLLQGQMIIIKAVRPMLLRIENALVSYVIYIGTLIWPDRLSIYYPYPDTIPMWEPALAAAFLILVTIAIICKSKKSPFLATGWFWYCGTLFPAIGLVQGGLWPAYANRFIYIPQIGLFIMAAWGIPAIIHRVHLPKAIMFAGGITAIICLCMVTRTQLTYWSDNLLLFSRANAVTTNNFIALCNMGESLKEKGKIKEAIRCLETAIKLQSDYPPPYILLSKIYYEKKDFNTALKYAHQAAWIFDSNPDLYDLMGKELMGLKQYDKAIDYYKRALRIKESDGTYNDLAAAYIDLEKPEKAKINLMAALRINPKNATAYANLGLLMLRSGQLQKALQYYMSALKYDTDNPEINKKIGDIMMLCGRIDEGITHYRKAATNDDKNEKIPYNIGIALLKKNKTTEALIEFNKALAINPVYKKAIRAIEELKR